MNQLIIIAFLYLSCFSLFSQDGNNENLTGENKKYTLGISPSALLNVYPTLQLSHEYKINQKLRFGFETGYVFTRFSDYNVRNVNGFRLRPALKYSFQSRKDDFFSLLFFYNYRYTKADQQREVWRDTGGYTEFIRGSKTTIFDGPGFGFDKGFLMDSWFFRFGLGFGVGRIRNDYNPDELQNEPGFFLFNNIFNELKGKAPIWYFNLCFGLI